MYRRLRNGLVIGALLILAASFARYRMERGLPVLDIGSGVSAASEVQASATVERGDIRVTVSATGAISPARRLYMLFPLPGKVDSIMVEEGQAVRAGQELARLNTRDLEFALRSANLALEQQQINIDALTAEPREVDLLAAQAAVYAAGAQVEAARVPPNGEMTRIAELRLELARNQLWQQQMQRDRTVAQQEFLEGLNLPALPAPPSGSIPDFSFALAGLIPNATQAEAGVARSEYDVQIAEQQLQQAQSATADASQVAAAQAQLVSAQAQLDRLLEGASDIDLQLADAQLQTAYLGVELARYQLEQATLRAPFDGVVSRINLVQGQAPPTNQPAVELIDISSYHIMLAVDEIDIAQLRVGQPVEVILDATPDETVAGVVARINDVATDLGGLITYGVEVTLAPADIPIRAGMSSTATVIVDEVTDVLRVRNRFVRLDRRTGRAYVTLQLPDGTLEEREVVLGQRNETYSEIISGASEGDIVVLVPTSGISRFGF